MSKETTNGNGHRRLSEIDFGVSDPLDIIGWAFIGSLALVLGFGVSAEAAIVINLTATFFGERELHLALPDALRVRGGLSVAHHE